MPTNRAEQVGGEETVIVDERGDAGVFDEETQRAFEGLELLEREATTPEQRQAVEATRKELTKALKGAATDGLTGLGTRKLLDTTLEREVARADRSDQPLSVLALDIDRFKAINERNGHPVGNQAIQFIADVIRSVVRTSDEAFRPGGDEFVLVLPDTDSEGARVMAERLRAKVEDLSKVGHEFSPFTISIGCASLSLDIRDGNSLEKSADLALLEAKRRGRNCVEVFNPSTHVERVTPAERKAAERVVRDITTVEALFVARSQGDNAAMLSKLTELGVLPEDPNERRALLEALLALEEEEEATGTGG